jgi:diguanylate cyclase (GGDEF)-like protein
MTASQPELTVVSAQEAFCDEATQAARAAGLRVHVQPDIDQALAEFERGPSHGSNRGGGPRLVLLDARTGAHNPYEVVRRLTSGGNVRLALAFEQQGAGDLGELRRGLAWFCGAGAVLAVGELRSGLERALTRWTEQETPRGGLDSVMAVLPEQLLRQLGRGLMAEGYDPRPARMIEALADPETSLFNYDFLTYKLDEEFKRSRRFEHPLTCVMLELDGECNESVLQELGSLILQAARDTDILGRFDLSSFLFLLPETSPEGARAMAERIVTRVAELGLRDVVGDPLQPSVGIVACPHPDVNRAEDLYRLARTAAREAAGSGQRVALHG